VETLPIQRLMGINDVRHSVVSRKEIATPRFACIVRGGIVSSSQGISGLKVSPPTGELHFNDRLGLQRQLSLVSTFQQRKYTCVAEHVFSVLSANEVWGMSLYKDVGSGPYIRSMFVVLGVQAESPRVLAQ
jgi:hypothetical protein